MKRFVTGFLCLILALLSILPVFAQQPSRIETQAKVLADLSQRVGVPGLGLGSLVDWNWFFGPYDFVVGQGCIGAPSAAPVDDVWQRFELNYKGTPYVYLISNDAQHIVLCNEAALSTAVPGIASATPVPGQPATITPPPLAMMTSTPVGNGSTGSLAPTATTIACPLQPHLVSGQGRVLPGDPNWLHDGPMRSSTKIGEIPAGSVFTVLQGPVCDPATHMNYWQVTFNGLTGWTSEGLNGTYWLEIDTSMPPFTAANAAKVALAAWLSSYPKGIRDIGLSLDGSTMVVLDASGSVTLYDAPTLTFKNAMLNGQPIARIAINSWGTYVAAAQADSGVVMWDTATNTVRGPAIHTGAITAMAFTSVYDSTSQLLVVATDEGKLWLWEAAGLTPQSKPLAILPAGGTAVALEFNTSGTMLVARDSTGGVLGVWQIKP